MTLDSPAQRPQLRYAFNTNGCAHHKLSEAIEFMADCGYAGVALTVDHQHLDPLSRGWRERTEELANQLQSKAMSSVIETGARFLMNPKHKHAPTLLAPTRCERKRRIHFLKRCIDIAAILESECVSFWSGVNEHASHEQGIEWLQEGLAEVLAYADKRKVVAALEPEPGHLIDTIESYLQLEQSGLELALDIGHVWVTNECEPVKAIENYHSQAATMAIEDMPRGVHRHCFFGEGDLDVRACVQKLQAVQWQKLVTVELSRDSHRAHETIPGAIEFLRSCES